MDLEKMTPKNVDAEPRLYRDADISRFQQVNSPGRELGAKGRTKKNSDKGDHHWQSGPDVPNLRSETTHG